MNDNLKFFNPSAYLADSWNCITQSKPNGTTDKETPMQEASQPQLLHNSMLFLDTLQSA